MAGKMDLGVLLKKQWLLANRLGAYCSTTFAGCNTSRYQGLLIASANPPVERIMAVSNIMETLCFGDKRVELATNEFADNVFSPTGWECIRGIHAPNSKPDQPAAITEYLIGKTRLQKSIIIDVDSNTVVVRYEITGQLPDEILLRPFTPMRDFHSLCCCDDFAGLNVHNHGLAAEISLPDNSLPSLNLSANGAQFIVDQLWWYRFFYSQDASRGQGCFEDLPSPGFFKWLPAENSSCEIVATFADAKIITFDELADKKCQLNSSVISAMPDSSSAARRLAIGGEDFIVNRTEPSGRVGASILAGFPWFSDWGRDTFIALPGMTLATGRFDLARDIFRTYAENISEGMIPNRFDDYGGPPHYNSMDASLWFILAAERFMQADDSVEAKEFWREVLRDACVEIVSRYRSGTRFGIHEDSDGLIVGGDENTQLTWMDAKVNGQAVTPRHGKAVELNALWYLANKMIARRGGVDRAMYESAAEKTGQSFVIKFWLGDKKYLADCVYEDHVDDSLRPNQIIAAALPISPLNNKQRTFIVSECRKHLLTSMGLRTLGSADGRYHGQYFGPQELRDMGYHQGTVWTWPIGFFVEAYLATTRGSKTQAKKILAPLLKHLNDACVGQINEIFDGDSPHLPRGCFAQAWSVAEILRALKMIE